MSNGAPEGTALELYNFCIENASLIEAFNKESKEFLNTPQVDKPIEVKL